MKRLGLFRHAKSDWSDSDLRDFDRGLNARGRKAAAAMGQHIATHGICWQHAIASPASRVRQTIDGAARAAGTCPPVVWEERAYLANAALLMEILRQVGEQSENVILCGHSPGLEHLLHELAGQDQANPLLARIKHKFPTACFAVIELDIEEWHELAPGCGKLVHVALPREIDPLLGPDR